MKKYLPAFIIFLSVIASAIAWLNRNTGEQEQAMRWWLLVFFGLITFLFHWGITRATQSRPQVFVRYYMGATTLKLMLNLVIIVVYALLHRDLAVSFIITFMIFYFLFTVFEVIFTWKTVRGKGQA
jgi:hypothetical protein